MFLVVATLCRAVTDWANANQNFFNLIQFHSLTIPVNGLPLSVRGRLLASCCCGFFAIVSGRNVVPGRGAVANLFISKSSLSMEEKMKIQKKNRKKQKHQIKQ